MPSDRYVVVGYDTTYEDKVRHRFPKDHATCAI